MNYFFKDNIENKYLSLNGILIYKIKNKNCECLLYPLNNEFEIDKKQKVWRIRRHNLLFQHEFNIFETTDDVLDYKNRSFKNFKEYIAYRKKYIFKRN